MHSENLHKAYDIIGDVHGHGNLLEKLLIKLGYQFNGVSFAHPERCAIFCGDFIDRGRENIKALQIVMSMHASGAALAIPGNHDIAFVQYHTKLPGASTTIIPPNRHHDALFRETLLEFSKDHTFMNAYLNWVTKLPLFIELPDLRIYHGYYHPELSQKLKVNGEAMCYADVLNNFSKLSPMADLITKSLSANVVFKSNLGLVKERVRLKWWRPLQQKLSADDLLLQNNPELQNMDIVSSDQEYKNDWNTYGQHEKHLFLGHFCINEPHGIMLPNLCIIDLCVIKTGRLAAYRYEGEDMLKPEKIVYVTQNS